MGVCMAFLQPSLAEPPLGANGILPRRRVEAVGSTGWSASSPVAPTAPNFLWWAVLPSLVLNPCARPCPKPVCFGAWASFDPFEPESRALIC